MKALDVFKRPVSVGDFVAAATTCCKSTSLRVGKVINITEQGNVSIKLPGRKWVNKTNCIGFPVHGYVDALVSVTIHAGKFIIISPDSLPEDFKSKLI